MTSRASVALASASVSLAAAADAAPPTHRAASRSLRSDSSSRWSVANRAADASAAFVAVSALASASSRARSDARSLVSIASSVLVASTSSCFFLACAATCCFRSSTAPRSVFALGSRVRTSDDIGVELKGVRSGVERRRGVSGL
jgi:hypothetical protein